MNVKRMICGVLVAVQILVTGCAAPDMAEEKAAVSATMTNASQDSSIIKEDEMKVTSSAIQNGYIGPEYGANGDKKTNGLPTLSIPFEVVGAPEDTVCYAVYIDDPDAEPLCGYRWVHWMAVNIEQSDIPEDFSEIAPEGVVQGTNDNDTIGYAGPTPPDKDHTYVITVYALDEKLSLSKGFSKTEFADAIKGHVLATAAIEGIYKK